MLKQNYNLLQALDPKIIFEFGAFDGEDTFSYRESFPKAEIYSFEPDPLLYRLLEPQMEEKNIHFYNYAISDITEEADFHFARPKEGNKGLFPAGSLYPYTQNMKSSQREWWSFSDEVVKVNCISLQEFCAKEGIPNIDFIHMDVEGAVGRVLKGMGELRPPIILAEVRGREALFQGAPSLRENNTLFAQMGYIPVGSEGADTLYKLIKQ